MEKAVSRTLLFRAWSFMPGLASVLLIPAFLRLGEQGYYYSFGSVLGIQVFFELGLSQVLIYRFAGLSGSSSIGADPSQASSHLLLSVARKVYRYLAIIFFVVAYAAGLIFFNARPDPSIEWHGPWLLLVGATAYNLAQSVKLTYMEAVGYLHHVSIARLQSSIIGVVSFILVIAGGGRLWAVCAMPFVNAIYLTIWLYTHQSSVNYRESRIQRVPSFPIARSIWMQDVFPMQWKISLSWISGYLISQLYIPLVFSKLGSVEAGKLGYLISLSSPLVVVATTFTSALAPQLSSLYSKRKYAEFNSVFLQSLRRSVTALFFSIFLVPVGVFFLGLVNSSLSSRILSPIDASYYSAGLLFSGITYALSFYLRSQQDEPLLLVSIVSAIVMIPVLVISLSYSMTCMLLSASCVNALTMLWTFSIYSNSKSCLQGCNPA